MFGSLSSGITDKKKYGDWQEVTRLRKSGAKKRISECNASMQATGGGGGIDGLVQNLARAENN